MDNMATDIHRISAVKLTLTIVYLLIFPIMILLLSGDWLWLEGWIFSLWFIILCITCIFYLYRHNPALLAERYKRKADNQAGWDRYFVFGVQLAFLIWIIIIPLDAKRFVWTTHFPIWVEITGGVILLFSSFFFFRSYRDNSFLSPLVRVQPERQQKVISTGVYGFVRHPMYLAGVLLFFGTPMLLGSVYGILFGIVFTLMMMGRIIGEEKLLAKELDGYGEYKLKVKYRLIPFVW
jgi:protein-S-isoprenylcysteine O-methyltransferase Ste14